MIGCQITCLNYANYKLCYFPETNKNMCAILIKNQFTSKVPWHSSFMVIIILHIYFEIHNLRYDQLRMCVYTMFNTHVCRSFIKFRQHISFRVNIIPITLNCRFKLYLHYLVHWHEHGVLDWKRRYSHELP